MFFYFSRSERRFLKLLRTQALRRHVCLLEIQFQSSVLLLNYTCQRSTLSSNISIIISFSFHLFVFILMVWCPVGGGSRRPWYRGLEHCEVFCLSRREMAITPFCFMHRQSTGKPAKNRTVPVIDILSSLSPASCL